MNPNGMQMDRCNNQWNLKVLDEHLSSANSALGKRDTPKVLDIVLSRVYTLRNQLLHGGSTWNSSVNRDQLRDCAKFMEYLVPVVIEIMMDNAGEVWGQPCYPVVT